MKIVKRVNPDDSRSEEIPLLDVIESHSSDVPIEEPKSNNNIDVKFSFSSFSKSVVSFVTKKTVFGATFNFSNGAIDIGIVMLPFVFRECGVVIGLGSQFVCAILGSIAQYFLFRSYVFCRRRDPQIRDYEDIGYYFFGIFGSIFVQILLFLSCYATVVTFSIIVGDIFMGWIHSTVLRDIVLFLSLLPFIIVSIFERVTQLSFVSYFSIVITLTFVVTVIASYFTGVVPTPSGSAVWFPDLGDFESYLRIVSVLGIVFNPYDISTFVCNIADDFWEDNEQTKAKPPWTLKNIPGGPHIHKVGVSIFSATVFMFITYTIVSEFGYISFIGDTHSDVIKNYESLVVEDFLGVLLCLMTLFTYPFALFPARYALINIFDDLYKVWLKKKKGRVPTARKKWVNSTYGAIVTIILGISAFFIAIVFPYASDVYNFVGGSINIATSYILPCIFYLKMMGIDSVDGLEEKKKIPWWHPKKGFVWFLLVFSSVASVVITILSIVQFVEILEGEEPY